MLKKSEKNKASYKKALFSQAIKHFFIVA